MTNSFTRLAFKVNSNTEGNSTIKKLAVPWLNQIQFSDKTSEQVDSFLPRNHQLHKPANRYGRVKKMTIKFYILTLLTFCSLTLFAQNGPSIINDSDGFTNVRLGSGTEFEVIDTLFNEDFFYFKLEENSDWAKVTVWKGRQIEGFIHKSRIQEVKT